MRNIAIRCTKHISPIIGGEEFGYCNYCNEDPCTCNDHLCCFEPGYTGPGSCRCREYFKHQMRQDHWFWRRWDKVLMGINRLMYWVSQWTSRWIRMFTATTICANCKQESLYRKWKDGICPECGEEDLPF